MKKNITVTGVDGQKVTEGRTFIVIARQDRLVTDCEVTHTYKDAQQLLVELSKKHGGRNCAILVANKYFDSEPVKDLFVGLRSIK